MRPLALLVRELTSDLRCYLLATAIVAVALRLTSALSHLYRTEPCTGPLHQLYYRLAAALPWSSSWW